MQQKTCSSFLGCVFVRTCFCFAVGEGGKGNWLLLQFGFQRSGTVLRDMRRAFAFLRQWLTWDSKMLLLGVSGGKQVGHGLWLELVLIHPSARLTARGEETTTGGGVASRKPWALPARVYSFS